MDRHLLDRWTDTTLFRASAVFLGLPRAAVLGIGVLTTVIGGAVVVH